jgi:hypothetical protein
VVHTPVKSGGSARFSAATAVTAHTASQDAATYFPILFECPILSAPWSGCFLSASQGTSTKAVKTDLENSMLKQPDIEVVLPSVGRTSSLS